MNKRQKNIINRHKWSDMYDLYDAYNSFSHEKYKAFQHCLNTCLELKGYNLRIIGRNSHQFSVGFYYRTENTNQLCFYYITKDNEEWWEVE